MTEPTQATFQTRLKGPDLLRLGAVAAAAVALVVGAAAVIGASTPQTAPTAGGASPGASAQASPPAKGNGNEGRGPWKLFAGGPSGFGFGFGPGRGLRGGLQFGQITITAIDGSKISLKTDDGWTRTIELTSTTSITKAGQAISAADLKVGDRVVFRQTRNADGSFNIAALQVVVPKVAGSVTAVSVSGFTLKARDGTTWTVAVTGSTAFSIGSRTGARSDVKVGVDVLVEGNQGTGNTLTALSVHVQLPHVVGQVTAKTASTLTIKRPDGTTATIHVGTSTTYRLPGKATASLADIAVGAFIAVEGTQLADGSIDASVVTSGRIRGPDRPLASPSAG
jgi:hypothetical protein